MALNIGDTVRKEAPYQGILAEFWGGVGKG